MISYLVKMMMTLPLEEMVMIDFLAVTAMIASKVKMEMIESGVTMGMILY